ncbi:hypothetical protein L7F22_026025 [Adiantum nelumboides]|nr:hypothetical protein [Adiantum nelumboides]
MGTQHDLQQRREAEQQEGANGISLENAVTGEDNGGSYSPNGHGANASLKIDPSFVVPPEHRPLRAPLAPLSHQIPVIDLSPLTSLVATARESIVSQVGCACQEWGFFQVINHGIPQTLIQKLRDEARTFFELPLQKKLEVKRSFNNFLGYNDGELTKNVRDWKEVYDMAPAGSFELPADFDSDNHHTLVHINQWPSFMPSLRKVCEEYMAALDKLAFTLLELMAESLGLSPYHFHEDFKLSTTSLFRLNHYPVCPAPELALGVSRHKDVGALTILLQGDVGGLEVKSKNDEWIGVKPNPEAFVINVGDITQVYSNDKYRSVEHRVVVNENKDRYSFPYFFTPAHSVDLAPITELISDENRPRYRPFNWGKYLKSRFDSNYKNLGVENLQISDYSLIA